MSPLTFNATLVDCEIKNTTFPDLITVSVLIGLTSKNIMNEC